MMEDLTPASLASAIRLQRDLFEGAFLLVEGNNDVRVYEKFVDKVQCQIIICHDKDRVIGVVELLDNDRFQGFIAIVDMDFWTLDEINFPSDNLLLTDTHDIETMMLQSPAFDKVLSEFASITKLEKQRNLREMLLITSKDIGYLRWLSIRNELYLNFENLKFSRFVKIKGNRLVLNLNRLISMLLSRSNARRNHNIEIDNNLDALRNDDHDLWHLCCGHDLISLLSIAL